MAKFKYINTSEQNPFTTKIFMEESKSIIASKYDRWLYVEGNGIIDQLFIDSSVNDYKIKIIIDDRILWNEAKAFSWFDARDDWLQYVSAFPSGAKYILSIRELYFKDSFSIEYTPVTAGTFTTAMCRYTVRDGMIKK